MKKFLLPLTLVAIAFACKSSEQTELVVENTTCPISGHPVDGKSSVTVEGKKVNLCCSDCSEKATADPAGTLAKAYPAK